jgi:sialate O-acetylesterase
MRFFCALLVTLVGGWSAKAEVKMPAIFGDHMVLQQQSKIPVWGTAEPGESVKVALGADTAETKAAADGKWRIDLAAMPMNASPQTLTVTGKNTLTFQDVLVGEVWLGSGQSNMEVNLGQLKGQSPAIDEAIAGANNPLLRVFLVGHAHGSTPNADLPGQWKLISPDVATGFSALAYSFGKLLQEHTHGPVGMIDSSWGGSAIEDWMSVESLRPFPPAILVTKFEIINFNGMIAPLMPYAIRGVLWDQGEANTNDDGTTYGAKLTSLITDWRARFEKSDLPFLVVGLANWSYRFSEPTDSGWSGVREGQVQVTERVPHTALATALDLGETDNIHPWDKMDVARRLLACALHTAYGGTAVFEGPRFAGMKIEGNVARISYRDTRSLLTTRVTPFVMPDNPALPTDKIVGFAIAGEDKKWVFAHAEIDGATVKVSSPAVPKPVAVRYGWGANPAVNLYNQAGFPAVPFRTDNWPFVPPPPFPYPPSLGPIH